MSKEGLISNILSETGIGPNSPLLFQNGKSILTYGELIEFISNGPKEASNSKNPYQYLEWEVNNVDFICRYFQLINHGIIPILVDKRRILKAPNDYSKKDLENSLKKNQLKEVVTRDDCATVIYTSGSTGKPKGVRISLANILSAAKATNKFYQINEQDNWALSLPLFHIGGLMILWRCLLAGASTTLTRPENLEDEIIHNKQITIASMVQIQLDRILTSKNIQRFTKLKGIVLGGSKISDSLLEDASDKGIKLSNSFGATESCAQFFATPFTRDIEVLSTIGRPMSQTAEIIDEKLILKGESIALGYLNQEDFSSCFKTNDKAIINEAGNFLILGRADNVFQKAAENINPEIIEARLNKELRTTCYIIPLRNETYENLIGLICDKRESLEKIKAIINEKLISFERPHLLFQANDLLAFQKGIKINRNVISDRLNDFVGTFSEKLYLTLSGNIDGNILIVSHGFMGEACEFDKYLDELKENYLIIYLDLPGHGENYKIEKLEEYKEEVIKLLTHFQNSKKSVNFLTYSMSARIFQEILRDERLKDVDNLNHFINESGSPGFQGNDEARKRRLAHDMRIFEEYERDLDATSFYTKWYQQTVFKKISSLDSYNEMITTKTEQIKKMSTYWSKAAGELSVARQDNLINLNELPNGMKYHYIHGKLDTKYSQYAAQLQEYGAKTYEISKASHNTHDMSGNEYRKIIHKILN